MSPVGWQDGEQRPRFRWSRRDRWFRFLVAIRCIDCGWTGHRPINAENKPCPRCGSDATEHAITN